MKYQLILQLCPSIDCCTHWIDLFLTISFWRVYCSLCCISCMESSETDLQGASHLGMAPGVWQYRCSGSGDGRPMRSLEGHILPILQYCMCYSRHKPCVQQLVLFVQPIVFFQSRHHVATNSFPCVMIDPLEWFSYFCRHGMG